MSIYYFNLLLILGLAYPLCVKNPTERKKAVYLCVTFGFLLLLCSLREGIGNDYQSYIDIYEKVGGAPLSSVFSLGVEPGYALLAKLLYSLSLPVKGMYFVMGLLCLLPVAWFIFRYSRMVWLSVWCYVTLTFFYGIMNFVRQNLALSVLLLGFPLLKAKSWRLRLLYIPVILLACSFHKTAVVMLPIMFLCQLPLNRWLGIAYTALAAVLYLTSRQLLDFITTYIFTEYRGSIYIELGFGLHFLIIPAMILAFVVLLPFVRKKILERCPYGQVLVNTMLFNFLIWLFITRHFVLERFSLYVYIYVLLALPEALFALRPDEELLYELDTLQAKESQKGAGAKLKQGRRKQERAAEVKDRVITRQMVYFSALAVIIIATAIYNNFGMYDAGVGFHGVFPYRSFVGFFNALP